MHSHMFRQTSVWSVCPLRSHVPPISRDTQGRTICHLYYVALGEGNEITRAFNDAFRIAAAEEQKFAYLGWSGL